MQPIYIYKFDCSDDEIFGYDSPKPKFKYFLLNNKIIDPNENVVCYFRFNGYRGAESYIYVSTNIYENIKKPVYPIINNVVGISSYNNHSYFNSKYFNLAEFNDLLHLLNKVNNITKRSFTINCS